MEHAILHLRPDEYGTHTVADADRTALRSAAIIGPHVPLRAAGPLRAVHDDRFEPGATVAAGEHAGAERLLYVLEGCIEHRNDRSGATLRLEKGDLAVLTEGRAGMGHRQANPEDRPARVLALAYVADPCPDDSATSVLRDAEAQRFGADESTIKELIAEDGAAVVHGDLRGMHEFTLRPEAMLTVGLAGGEGALLFVVSGQLRAAEGARGTYDAGPGDTLLLPPAAEPREVTFEARDRTRLIQIIHGADGGLAIDGGAETFGTR